MKRETIVTKKFIKLVIICLITCVATFWLHQSLRASQDINTRLMDRALIAIHRHYIDPDRIEPRKMLLESLKLLQKRIPDILVTEDGKDFLSVTVGLAKKRFRIKPLRNLQDLERIMNQVVEFVSTHYKGDVKPDEIESTIINGMLDALDPHSSFLSKKIYGEFKVGTRGKFGGLGIVITMKDGMLTVISPIEGTPAFRAGLKAGDRIVQIGDESTINMSLTDAVNKLRGKPGTRVTVIVEREGRPSRKLVLTRAIINIDSVKYGVLNESGKHIGYLRVKSFQSNTCKDVKTALNSFHKGNKPIDGLILDLRNNPGGLLNIAVDLADLFLSEGIIVSTVGKKDEVLDLDKAHKSGTEPDYPIVVLINEGSASASEIVAGALQAQGRAVVMGSESFGKGSVQTIIELGSDTALKLTIARYKPAGTESIQLVGVIPDIELVPAIIDRDEINLFRDKLFTEKDLEEHLDTKRDKMKSKQNAPRYRLHYLEPKEDEEDEDKALEKRSEREYSKKLHIEDDFAVNLARKLIVDAGRGTRNSMLKLCKAPIDEERISENHKIDLALKKLGVNWSGVPAGGRPKLKLTSQILYDGKRIERGPVGKKINLELTATNTGTGTFSKLIAIGQSEKMSFLANREFPFGLIPPGKSRSWSVPMELPEGLETQNLVMDIGFEEGNGNVPEITSIRIPVKAMPQPSFAFSYKIPRKYKGRPFKTGTSIPFEIEVTNDGPGESSPDTFVSISDECNEKVFIEKGRTKLGRIKAGANKRAKMQFHMLPGYDESDCSIDLLVADIKQRLVLTKKIELHPAKGRMTPPPGTKLAPPKISLNKAPEEIRGKTVGISGTITDVDSIRDYYIYAGDSKIDYGTNPGKSSVMKFKADVPLEPGNNRIVIGSRDEHDITGTKVIVIERIGK